MRFLKQVYNEAGGETQHKHAVIEEKLQALRNPGNNLFYFDVQYYGRMNTSLQFVRIYPGY